MSGRVTRRRLCDANCVTWTVCVTPYMVWFDVGHVLNVRKLRAAKYYGRFDCLQLYIVLCDVGHVLNVRKVEGGEVWQI